MLRVSCACVAVALALLSAGDSTAQPQQRPVVQAQNQAPGQAPSQPDPAPTPPPADAQPPVPQGPLSVRVVNPPLDVRVVPSPKTEAQYDAEQRDRDDRAALGDQLLMFAALLVAVGAFLAVAFAVQALYLGLGFRAMRHSAALAERNMTAAQRAFVYLGSIGWSGSGGNIKVGPVWANAGTTPTRNLRIATNWKASHGELPVDFPYAYVRPPERLFLGPNGKAEFGAVLIPMRDIQGALEERLQIHVWGRATYEDVFEGSKPHYCEFCHRLDVTGTPGNLAIGFSQYGLRNGCDEDTQKPVEA